MCPSWLRNPKSSNSSPKKTHGRSISTQKEQLQISSTTSKPWSRSGYGKNIIEHRIPASLGEAPREICLRIKQTVDEFNKRRMSKESPEAATKRMIQEHEDRLDRSPY
jgi:hypothetical protein